jgi:hypothetical protein
LVGVSSKTPPPVFGFIGGCLCTLLYPLGILSMRMVTLLKKKEKEQALLQNIRINIIGYEVGHN